MLLLLFFFINILILSFYSYIYTKKTKYSVCMYMGLFIIHVSIFILNLIYKKLIQIFADIMKPKIIIIYTLNLIGEFYVAHVITTRYLQHSEIDKKKKKERKKFKKNFFNKKRELLSLFNRTGYYYYAFVFLLYYKHLIITV